MAWFIVFTTILLYCLAYGLVRISCDGEERPIRAVRSLPAFLLCALTSLVAWIGLCGISSWFGGPGAFLLIALVLYGLALAAMVRSARLARERAAARPIPRNRPDALRRLVRNSAAAVGAAALAAAILAGMCIRIFGSLSWDGLGAVYDCLLHPGHQILMRTAQERLADDPDAHDGQDDL